MTASPASAVSPTTGDVTGTVTGAGGAPLNGVTISDGASTLATTDAAGHYTIADLAPGQVALTASTTGYVPSTPAYVTVTANATVTQDFQLVQNSSISGIVTAPDTTPVAGATVTLGGASAGSATTDATGAYTFDSLAPGVYTLDFDAPGLISPATQTVTITTGGSAITANAQFLAPSTINGTVLDPSGNPAAGVSVTATGPVTSTATSAADGTYSLTDLAPGVYSLTFHLDGYVDPAPVSVTVTAAGDTVTAATASLVAPSTISGVVSNADPAPVAGATVTIDGPTYATTTTDANGAYSFTTLPAGTYNLTVSAAGYVDSPSIPVTITNAGDTVTQDVTLNRTSSVTVFVADSHGVPVDGAAVVVTGADNNTYPGTTDATGNTTITGLAPGNYTITSSALGYFTAPATSFTVAAYDTNYNVSVPVLSPASVSGIVTDPSGNPLPGATVNLEGVKVHLTTTSGADGSYTFDGLDVGQYTVSASASGFVAPTPQTVSVTDYGTTSTVQLQFQLGSSIIGEATINEVPTGGVTVTLNGPVNATTTTAPDGTYSFGVLPLGTYTVSFDLNGYISPADQSVTISTPGSTTTVNGELNVPSTVSGSILDPNGNPLAGATITLDGPVYATATSANDGTFTVDGLDVGTYTVTVHADGYIDPAPDTITISAYGTNTVYTAAVFAPSSISGTVTSSAGPVDGATVTIDGPTWSTTTTAADGTYSLGVLPPGSYSLTVTAPGYVDSATITVDVPTYGSNVTADVTLAIASSADVLVTDASLNPIENAAVNVAGADGNTYLATTDASGHALVAGLPNGDYTATASADGYVTASATFSVTSENSTVPVSITLNATDTIKGNITDSGANAVADAVITVSGSNGDTTAISAADGHYTVPGLVPGTYTVRVAADGFYTSAPQTVTFADFGVTTTVDVSLFKVGEVSVPGAPTAVRTRVGDGQVTVSWAPPASDGGAPVYQYTVTASSALSGLAGLEAAPSCTTDGNSNSCVVTGLTNGMPYVFAVVATNVAGDGPAATSIPVIPAGRPSTPTGLKAVAGNTTVKVSWQASNGNGFPVVRYTVTASPGGRSCVTASLSCTVTGLTDGVLYTFSVTATNFIATSLPGTIKARPTFVPTVTNIKAKPNGSGKALITFSKPKTTEAIVDYKLEILVKGKWVTYNDGKSAKTSISVKGLKAKTAYQGRITPIPSRGKALTSKPFKFTTG